MFQGWTFLVGEIWGLLLLAGLLGLGCGWLIGRTRAKPVAIPPPVPDATLKAARAKGRAEAQAKLKDVTDKLERARVDAIRRDARMKALEGEIESLRAELAFNPPPGRKAPPAQGDDAPGVDLDQDFDGDGLVEPKAEGRKPVTLVAPRNGVPDDLTRINGIGPKLRDLCHMLGVFHIDQIAGWSAAEVAWMDANLAGFKGRVTRDEWVAQARALVAPL